MTEFFNYGFSWIYQGRLNRFKQAFWRNQLKHWYYIFSQIAIGVFSCTFGLLKTSFLNPRLELRALFSLDEWNFIQRFHLRVWKKHRRVLAGPPVLPGVQQGESGIRASQCAGAHGPCPWGEVGGVVCPQPRFPRKRSAPKLGEGEVSLGCLRWHTAAACTQHVWFCCGPGVSGTLPVRSQL